MESSFLVKFYGDSVRYANKCNNKILANQRQSRGDVSKNSSGSNNHMPLSETDARPSNVHNFLSQILCVHKESVTLSLSAKVDGGSIFCLYCILIFQNTTINPRCIVPGVWYCVLYNK